MPQCHTATTTQCTEDRPQCNTATTTKCTKDRPQCNTAATIQCTEDRPQCNTAITTQCTEDRPQRNTATTTKCTEDRPQCNTAATIQCTEDRPQCNTATTVQCTIVGALRTGNSVTQLLQYSQDSLLVTVPDSRSKGCKFESRQEWRENFLLQCQLCVLTLYSVSVPPPYYHGGT